MTVNCEIVGIEEIWLVALMKREAVLLDGKDKAEDPVYDLR